RDAADIEVHRPVLVLVDVQLRDREAAGLLDGDLLEHRGDHAARTAPLCPEIDQDGRLALGLGLKNCIGNVCGLSHVRQSSWDEWRRRHHYRAGGAGPVRCWNTYGTPPIPPGTVSSRQPEP